MKRLFIVTLVCLIILISFFTPVHGLPYPPEMDVIYIKFNYTSGYSYDALTIKKNNSTQVQVPEWYPSYNRNEPFAYIKSQSNRKIEAKLWVEGGGREIIKIKAIMSGQGIGNINTTSVFFNGSQYATKVMTCSGSVPGSVGIRNFSWSWYATQIDDYIFEDPLWIGGTGNHEYYTLLAAPQSPMAVPWTIVLDDASKSNWAGGQTSVENAANQITSSLYTSGFKYETIEGGAGYGNFEYFDLTEFDSDIGSSNSVNCLDMAKAVVTYSNAIGCNLNLTTYGQTKFPGENPINYPLNCIDPIGTPSPTNNPFSSPLIANDCRSGGFGYHAFAERTSNNNVWDATLKYDIDSDPDNVEGSNPGCGTVTSEHIWKLPTNEGESTYIDRLLDDWPQKFSASPTWNRNRSFSVE